MRVHFDLTNGTLTFADEEGVEVADLNHAITEARAAVHEVMENGELDRLPGSWTIVIRSEDGSTLASLPVE